MTVELFRPCPHWGTVDDGTSIAGWEVFRGSRAECLEFGLVLDAKGLGYERVEAAGVWCLLVAPAMADIASDELRRYAAEKKPPRERSTPLVVFPGSGIGAAAYAFVLIAIAYCVGINLFGVDWLNAGALTSQAGGGDWWRAITALTLHLDQEHLLGNLLFGIGIGILAGRMFGPGVAWLAILVAGAAGDYVDMIVSPSWHRAAGASTAVFAALGLLAGFGWGRPLMPRERRFYRWGPLFAGVCLLALLGAGDAHVGTSGPAVSGAGHVDVLGHVLGFVAGTALGWLFARARIPRTRSTALQWLSGSATLALLGAAWILALRHAG